MIAEVLLGSGHENRSYEITGPELLDFNEVAQRFSDVLGKEIDYVDMPLDDYHAVLIQFIPSEWHANAVCELFKEIAEGGLDHITDTAEQLLGRPPTSLTQFIEDHRAIFTD